MGVICQKYATRHVLIFWGGTENIAHQYLGIGGIFPILALFFHLSPQKLVPPTSIKINFSGYHFTKFQCASFTSVVFINGPSGQG